MKKTLIITIGVVLILMVLAVWGYLLFFGTPNNSDDVFTNLGFGGPSQPITDLPDPVTTSEDPFTELGNPANPLRQLTTKPIAGFTFVGTSSELIRYAERGTGHIFEIDILENTEKRVSGTTVPRVVEAVFSSDGSSVALVSEDGYRQDIVAGIIDPENLSVDYISLPPNAFAPAFISTSVLRYAVSNSGGSEGFELNIEANDPVRLFSIPLSSVHFLWNEVTYAYSRPTRQLTGTLYTVKPDLTPVTSAGFNFVAGTNDVYYTISESVDGQFLSYAVEKSSGDRSPLPVTFIPEKCTFVESNSNVMWCAATENSLSDTDLESWYQGAITMTDLLWQVDIDLNQAILSANFLVEAGRTVDVDTITADYLGEVVTFRNKIDNTLWLYDSRLD